MELILQQALPHQQKAVDAICAALDGVQITAPKQFYENPHIMLTDPRLAENVRELQNAVPPEYRSNTPIGNCLNLDIKMETGTGKTYVYTKVMFELHKRYGINKFIIAVPSLAIKAGTAQFLRDEYARRHFADGCGYGTEIEVGILEAPKNKKKGRSYFPSVVSDFVKGSCQDTKKIHVLLMNMQLLVVRANGMLSRDDYDYGAEGFYRPLDAIRATRPVVIIDEPHRFSRDQKAFKVITDEICPQSIIRFGATFPETTSGRGKNKVTVKDYQNLLYDLNACASFNQNLIKGVAKEHFEPVSKREEKVKITSIASKDSVTFQYKKRDEATKSYTLKTSGSLSIISDAFEGITVYAIGNTKVEFSNGVIKSVGEELDVDIYMTSYQEQMIRLALERHFETERENFCGRTFKIKTLALFFIDDISSYRPGTDGKEPYLRLAFERLLKERIEAVLATLDDHDAEYRAYLKASLADISACHAGYFSQDNSDSDEDVAKEVDEILNGKKQLLSFKNTDGSYNTLRFLFSKWTLKEGWDNPNVFTIAKLRSSGSENSKLQEVGRGLRLPVDENGNRISNEEFQLNYIVDFTEADFAQRLVNQINGEIPQAITISEEKLQQVAKKLGVSSDNLFDALYAKKHYIDRHYNIKPETRDAFLAEYPDFFAGLSTGKVKDRNKDKPRPIKIRKAAYSEIKELWEKINQRYLLFYDADINEDMNAVILSILEQPGTFTDMVIRSARELVKSDGDQMEAVTSTGVQYTVTRPIPYGLFLKRISQNTNVPVTTLHNALCEYVKRHGHIEQKFFNDNSAIEFCSRFRDWKTKHLQGRFHYAKSRTPCGATALTYADGTPRTDIAQGRIGTKIIPGTPSAKYLYDVYAYDSPLEKDNITANIEEVVVFGKIPRSSIAIPTITGEMYSPDFMYIVKRKSGEKELNIVVETKDVEGKSSLRPIENAKIECARVFFDMLSRDGYTVYFRDQLNNKQMAQIINEVLT
ncbi:type III restriction-modification system endonuclease [Caproiciproducens sp. CPB-2]|uniref:type III restriction-modification system endonuclease n=1 Tax=Caproiciproducens sp. CPB-2 TaxID=3030017 RepID=UPI0023D9F935|nr:type III restriction-modification system endonuclease [Caproiciproducens sp. CPB-2]MDF1494156.1 type III restriction-modification system endonuclease [Caproiciproducens sp. CPB-2]